MPQKGKGDEWAVAWPEGQGTSVYAPGMRGGEGRSLSLFLGWKNKALPSAFAQLRAGAMGLVGKRREEMQGRTGGDRWENTGYQDTNRK